MKRHFWNVFQPSNAFEETLVEDFVENWWRRERIRRAEAVELRTRVKLLDWRNELQQTDEVNKLRSRFWALYVDYMHEMYSQSTTGRRQIMAEFEDVRQQLISSSLGIRFLVRTLEYIQSTAEADGVLSPRNEVLLQACLGFGSEETNMCCKMNEINKKQSQNWPQEGNSDVSADEGEPTAEEVLKFAFKLRRAADNFQRAEAARTSDAATSPKTKPTQASSSRGAKREQEKSAKEKSDEKAMYGTVLAGAIGTPIAALRIRE